MLSRNPTKRQAKISRCSLGKCPLKLVDLPVIAMFTKCLTQPSGWISRFNIEGFQNNPKNVKRPTTLRVSFGWESDPSRSRTGDATWHCSNQHIRHCFSTGSRTIFKQKVYHHMTQQLYVNNIPLVGVVSPVS